jgi:hypothetical protein
MGLFSWLFGNRSRVTVRDAILLTNAARSRGAADAVSAHLDKNHSVLVLAHFPTSLAAFCEHVVRCGWTHLTIPSALTPAAALKLATESPRVLLGLVRNLKPDEFPQTDSALESTLPLLVLERHFLRVHDDLVVQFAEGLGSKAAVDFYLSLDDPLMSLFAGEWVRNTLRTLGMKEDEELESAMVGRRIKAAQARLAREVPVDHDANSPEEWLERNRAK